METRLKPKEKSSRANSNTGQVIVVEEILKLQQAREQEKELKHGKELFKPCLKPISKLLFWDIGFLCTILAACITWSIPISLIPTTNMVLFPSFWWEYIVNGNFVANSLYCIGMMMLEIKINFDLTFLSLLRPFAWAFALNFLTSIFAYSASYLVWTEWLGFNHPIPYLGAICYLSWYTTQYATMWFLFPAKIRKDKIGKRKVFAFLLYKLWIFLLDWQKLILNIVLVNLGPLQWIMGFVLPIFREINLWVLEKILETLDKSSDNLLLISKLTATVRVNLGHAVWVAIVISTKASRLTTYSVLAVEVLFNLYETYTIIRRQKSISPTNQNAKVGNIWKADVLKLVGVEMVEFLTPIAYALTFSIAFYGPNASMIGGVRFSGWGFQEVTDVESFLVESGMMFVADFACTIGSGMLLWKFSSVNMLEEGYKLLSLYWPLIAINLAGSMFSVISLNSIVYVNIF